MAPVSRLLPLLLLLAVPALLFIGVGRRDEQPRQADAADASLPAWCAGQPTDAAPVVLAAAVHVTLRGDRLHGITETWAVNVTSCAAIVRVFLFTSSAEPVPSPPAAAAAAATAAAPAVYVRRLSPAWTAARRTRAMLRAVRRAVPRADWVLKADDDAVVDVEALLQALLRHNARAPVLAGMPLRYPYGAPQPAVVFASGGAAYVLSRAAVRLLLDFCPETSESTLEDVATAQCLVLRHGVAVTPVPGMHPDRPDRMVAFNAAPSPDHVRSTPWLVDAAERPVTFHYVTTAAMQRAVHASMRGTLRAPTALVQLPAMPARAWGVAVPARHGEPWWWMAALEHAYKHGVGVAWARDGAALPTRLVAAGAAECVVRRGRAWCAASCARGAVSASRVAARLLESHRAFGAAARCGDRVADAAFAAVLEGLPRVAVVVADDDDVDRGEDGD